MARGRKKNPDSHPKDVIRTIRIRPDLYERVNERLPQDGMSSFNHLVEFLLVQYDQGAVTIGSRQT